MPSTFPSSLMRTRPACPICNTSQHVHCIGEQSYSIGGGETNSWLFRCTECDVNYRKFDRPTREVLSHFDVAEYNLRQVEARCRVDREAFYEFLFEFLRPPRAGARLLDVGCAFGHFMDGAADRGYEPVGVEVSAALADRLRRRRPYAVYVGDLVDLNLPEHSFDVVAFVDSFYYFEDPIGVLQESRRLLAPGGQLLLRVTNRNALAGFASILADLRGERVPTLPFWATDDAICCHSARSLRRALDAAGLMLDRVTSWERGKRLASLPPAIRAYYRVTLALTTLTHERVSISPGLVCIAHPKLEGESPVHPAREHHAVGTVRFIDSSALHPKNG